MEMQHGDQAQGAAEAVGLTPHQEAQAATAAALDQGAAAVGLGQTA
jgi:hypothetical protein